MKKRPAIFIDRDGTINEEVGYVNHIDRFKILPGVVDAIRQINHSFYLAVVVTNQSGVARGYFSENLVKEVHHRMESELGAAGVRLDRIFYCPHHPLKGAPPYLRKCECRKPKTGMIKRAVQELRIDLSRSFVVGDSLSDLELAENAGVPGILVLTGYGREVREKIREGVTVKPVYVAADLRDAVAWILQHTG